MTLVLPDTSVWARSRQPGVQPLLEGAIRSDRVLTTGPIVLELLRGARDRLDLEREARHYDALPRVSETLPLSGRARVVQEALGWRGYHRGPSAVDLLTAAAAEAVGAELWHCDRHFELIGEVTGQPMRRLGT